MITITKKPFEITVCGHAGYDNPGRDIVCAAVSILTHTLITSIDALTEDEITIRAMQGETNIKYKHLSDRGKLLLDAFLLGAKSVEKEYPDNVKIVQAME